jgi:hypothetical protein
MLYGVLPGGRLGQFTIEFYRIRDRDEAHAILDRVSVTAPDVDAASIKAVSMFDNRDMPQKPDGFRILDYAGDEVCRWVPGD